MAANVALRVRAGWPPSNAATSQPSGASHRSKLAKCCSASSSVGAMTAVWHPAAAATSAAMAATTVLPGAHVALQQPVHRRARAEVRADLVEGGLLGAASAQTAARRETPRAARLQRERPGALGARCWLPSAAGSSAAQRALRARCGASTDARPRAAAPSPHRAAASADSARLRRAAATAHPRASARRARVRGSRREPRRRARRARARPAGAPFAGTALR